MKKLFLALLICGFSATTQAQIAIGLGATQDIADTIASKATWQAYDYADGVATAIVVIDGETYAMTYNTVEYTMTLIGRKSTLNFVAYGYADTANGQLVLLMEGSGMFATLYIHQ